MVQRPFPDLPVSPAAQRAAAAFGVGLVYYGLARVSLEIVSQTRGIAIFWPAAGIAAGAMIAARQALAPWLLGAIFAAALAANLAGGNPPATALVFAFANSCEALLCAWLFRRLSGGRRLAVPADIGWLALATLIGVGAVAGAGTMVMALVDAGRPASLAGWAVWTSGDAVAVLTIAPLILAPPNLRAEDAVRQVAVALGWCAIAAAVTGIMVAAPGLGESVIRELPLSALMPIILGIGVTQRPWVAAWAGAAVSATILVTVHLGQGQFASAHSVPLTAATAQSLMAVSSLSMIGLALLFSERRQREAQLSQTMALLHQREANIADRALELQTILDTAPCAILIAHDAAGRRITANRAGADLVPLTNAGALRSLPLLDGTPVPIEALPLQRAGQGEETGSSELTFTWGDGRETTFFGAARTLRGADGQPRGAVYAGTDITAMRAAARSQQWLAELTARLRGDAGAAAVTSAALGAIFGSSRAGIALADESGLLRAEGEWTDGSVPALEGDYALESFGDAVARDLRAGRAVVIGDATCDPRLEGVRDAHLALSAFSSATVPIMRNDRLAAVLYLHNREPRVWTAADIAMLTEVADRSWAAIDRERVQAALVTSEDRLRTAMRAASMFAWESEFPDGRVFWSADAAQILQVPRDALPADAANGQFYVALHERPRLTAEYAAAVSRRQPHFVIEFEGIDGRFWRAESLIDYGPDGTPVRVHGITRDISGRRRTEQQGRVQQQLLEMIAREAPLADCLAATALETEALIPGVRVAVLTADEDRLVFDTGHAASFDADFLAAIKGETIEATGPVGAAVSAGAPVTSTDIAGDARWSQGWRQLCFAHDIAAFHAEPAIGPDGTSRAAVMLGFDTQRSPTARERSVAAFAAQIVAIAIAGERKREAMRSSDARNAFLLRLEERLVAAATVEEAMNAACEMLGHELGAEVVAIGEAESETGGDDDFDFASEWRSGAASSLCGAMRLADTGADRIANLRAGRVAVGPMAGLAAAIDVPLVRSGMLHARLIAGHGAPRIWSLHEIGLARETIARTIAAVERGRARAALAASEAQFRATAAALPGMLFVTTGQRHNIYVNAEYCAYTGRPEAGLLGDRWMDVLHPDESPRVLAKWQQAVAAGVGFSDEFRFRRHDGAWRWHMVRGLPVRDGDGAITRWVGVCTDIHDRHVGEDLMAQRVEQAVAEREVAMAAREAATVAREAAMAQLHEAQKLEMLGQLTGGVAHDFNNLLTPVMMSLDLLRRTHGDDRSQRLIDGALQGAERAKTLIQRLLSFARRQALAPRAVDAGQLIAGMRDLIDRSLGPSIRVVVDVAPDLPAALVDPNQLELALLNLAVNARDSMPGGGVLTISADADNADDCGDDGEVPGLPPGAPPHRYVRLRVSDTGQGMDAETLRRAIEPFFSTKAVGQGTGLGLSMVHGLAGQSGGMFRLTSDPGAGTTATLWLPATGAIAAPAVHNGTPRAAAAVRPATLLLVDDEELVRTAAAEGLRALGYRVTETAAAEAALAAIGGGLAPDLVITDHMMPGMTGAQLVHELRRIAPALPVLMMTGFADAEGRAAGVEVLAKPFGQADLAARVAALLEAVSSG